MQLSQHDIDREIQTRISALKTALKTSRYDSELGQLVGYLCGVRDAGVVSIEILRDAHTKINEAIDDARAEIQQLLCADAESENKLAI